MSSSGLTGGSSLDSPPTRGMTRQGRCFASLALKNYLLKTIFFANVEKSSGPIAPAFYWNTSKTLSNPPNKLDKLVESCIRRLLRLQIPAV